MPCVHYNKSVGNLLEICWKFVVKKGREIENMDEFEESRCVLAASATVLAIVLSRRQRRRKIKAGYNSRLGVEARTHFSRLSVFPTVIWFYCLAYIRGRLFNAGVCSSKYGTFLCVVTWMRRRQRRNQVKNRLRKFWIYCSIYIYIDWPAVYKPISALASSFF